VGCNVERIHHIDSKECVVKSEPTICSHPSLLNCELALTQLVVAVNFIRLLKKL
jgi:hypothetical protein